MTARYFPASMSSLRKRTSFFVYLGIRSATLLSPIHRVDKARSGTCQRNPRSVSRYIPPGFSERLQRLNECLPNRVEDDVVRLAVLGEVFLQVVDDLVCSERSHELDVLRVAHRGDVGAEMLGHLHRCGSDRSGGAVDEDALSLPEIRPSQA